MASPRDVEEEERRLDAKPRTAASASADAASSPAVPQAALPTGAANTAAANAARTNTRQANLRGPPLPAPAAATTTTSSSAGRDAAAGGTTTSAAVSEGDTPHLHHNTRAGHPQPWGVGGGIGAAPYRADAPVYGLVGRDSDMLPSVLGPTDYAALIAGGLGDATTLIGGGGGMPLQSHQERMEERARAAARRAVYAAHAQAAADASKKQEEGELTQGPPTDTPDAPGPAKTTDAAVDVSAGAGDRPTQSGDRRSGHHSHHTHTQGNHTHGNHRHDHAPAAENATPDAAVGDAKPKDPKQQASSGRNDPHLAPPSPPAACGRSHCSPGVAHDVGYEHDL